MEEGRKGGQKAKINPISRLAIRLLFVTLAILTYFERSACQFKPYVSVTRYLDDAEWYRWRIAIGLVESYCP